MKYAKLKRVYVSLYGSDSKSCGSQSRPCQSIAQAVYQVDEGGHIYLEGKGTEQRPYNCSSSPSGSSGIIINKNLTMKAFYPTPHVFCVEGFHFQKTNGEQRTLRLELSGIAFWTTPLTFEDWHQVQIINCSFHNTPRALSIHIHSIISFRLDIEGFSSFHNNSQCIKLLLLDYIGNISPLIAISISGTHFTQNGLYGVQRSERGVMKIASSDHKAPKQVDVHVFCEKVKCNKNQGPFVNLNVSTAITNETYKDLELRFNKLTSWKTSSGKKPNLAVHSLYFSLARKTRAKFVNLTYRNNPFVLCIKTQSDEADVDIKDAYFLKQSTRKTAGSCISIEANTRASLRILNSTFKENEADFGGSLFVNSPDGLLYVNITNVRFTTCKAAKYGCAITIGKPWWSGHHNQSSPQKLHLNLRNVTIERWKSNKKKCTAVYVLLKSGNVTVEQSKFHKKTRTTVGGALLVVTTGGKSNVTISKCSFKDNAVKAREGFIIRIVAGNGNAGIVTIADSTIINNATAKKKVALFISPKYRIRLVNITLISFREGFQGVSSAPANISFLVDISIDNCTFINNVYDVKLQIYDPTFAKVLIKNTLFISSSNETAKNSGQTYAVGLLIPPPKHNISSRAVIELDNNTFHSRPSSYLVLFFEGDKNVTIRRTIFRNCINAHRYSWSNRKSSGLFYKTATGAISILTNPDKPRNSGCILFNSTKDIYPSWTYDSRMVFEDSIFVENVGLESGAVYVSNGFTTFRRCTFRNNFGIQAGHIYSAFGTGQVDFEDCSFARTNNRMTISNISTFNKPTFVYSESGGPLNLRNTSMISLDSERNSFPILDISSGGHVGMDETSKLQCSDGQQLLLENATHMTYTEKNGSYCPLIVTVLKYSCTSCPAGYYSLQKGTSRGLVVGAAVECLPCPFGAKCIQSNIAAKPNFWGYQDSNHPPALQFIACPEQYCTSKDPESYNSCDGNRNGTLCGECTEGFSETLFSAECQKSEKCNNYTVWILTILLTVALVLYLLIKPPTLSFLGTQILWFNRRVENQSRDDLGVVEVPPKHFDSGYVKITFYFYQVAELLMVESIKECFEKIPFMYFLIAAFNFQVRTLNKGIGCPFVGLTAVTKQFLLSGTVFLAMSEVVIIYGVHSVINMIRRKEKPVLIHYMAVFMEVLLLGYERLAESSLTLIHCVSIGSGKQLFIDANVPCMQWWQYLLLAYIIVFVIPFIVVLYWGSFKLYRASVTASEFLAACMIPLPFLFYWFVKGILKRRNGDSMNTQVVNKDVLKILHGPFRKPQVDDNGTLYWESVLIGRRFVLLACQTFITNLMLRMVCMVGACFLMTIHHTLKNPYRDPLANKAETLSLAALSMIAVINLAKATLISNGVAPDGPDIPYLESLEWFEVCALTFAPALVSLLFTFAILSQLARLVVFLVKKCYRTWWQFRSHRWLIHQLREPLLDNAEQSSDEN